MSAIRMTPRLGLRGVTSSKSVNSRSFITTASSTLRQSTPLPNRAPFTRPSPFSAPKTQFSHRRNLINGAKASKHYAATVVGAGPAGITVVGNLLERDVKPLLWIDPTFNGGRVNARYREVPSNTKVKLFTDFATATAPFRDIVGAGEKKDSSLSMFQRLDPDKGCDLSYAADMLLMLTAGLQQTPGVVAQQGRLKSGTLGGKDWTLQLDHNGHAETVQSERLILCTGSSPNNSPLPVQVAGLENIDLDDALSPTKLEQKLSGVDASTIAVIGASHSAVLILRNLYNIAKKSSADIKIKWFTRHDLRYAEFMDGWILRDNTGLKGEAAVWAKENLEPETLPKSDVSKYITPVKYKSGAEKEVYAKSLDGVNYYVQAIGFDRDPVPQLSTSDGQLLTPQFDHDTGGFTVKGEAKTVPGLYGAGIAWPERVKDPHGNIEYAVGFWKFMKFIKRVSPAWN